MPEKQRLTLFVLLSAATLTVMTGAIISPVQNLIRDGLGIDPEYAGLIITTHGLFMALCSPFMGSLIDRKGVRTPFIGGLYLFGIAGGAGLLINSFGPLIASRAIMGIALSSIFTCINVIILDKYEGERRDRVMGWRGSAQSLGGIVWPPLGGFLGDISWHLPFSIYLLAVPLGITAYAAVKNPAPHAGIDLNPQENISILRITKNNPVILIILGLIFFSSFQLYAIVIYIPQLLELFGVTSSLKISSYIVSMATAAGLMSLIYGRIRSRLSYRAISAVGVLIWVIVFYTISTARSQVTIMISVFFLGASQGMIMPTVMAWIGEVVPVSFRGRFSSYLGTFGFMGQFLSPVLLAPALIHFGIRNVFTVSSIVGLVWFVILLPGLGKTHR